MTEAEAKASGRPVLVGTRPMTRVSRAIEKGETLGFMKVLADAESRAVLGVAILGTGGDEAVHAELDVMYVSGLTSAGPRFPSPAFQPAHFSEVEDRHVPHAGRAEQGWYVRGGTPEHRRDVA